MNPQPKKAAVLSRIKVLIGEIAAAEETLDGLRDDLEAAENELSAIEDREADNAEDELSAARADPRQIGLPL